jgi:hypothetical protein
MVIKHLRCYTTEGCQELKQWSCISTTKLGSVLQRVWENLDSEPISVLPTLGQYYRQNMEFLRKDSICARVGSVFLTLKSCL